MNNKKRNQLIGFITLVLIVLLISPYVITDKSKQREITIPLLPPTEVADNSDNIIESVNEFRAIDEYHYIDDVIDEPVSNTPEVNSQPNSTSGNTNVNHTAQQRVDKHYIIQLVALKNRQKIEELIALLIYNNYDAYIEPKVPKEGDVIRLFVGHYPTIAQAEMVIIDLEHLTKLKGIVLEK